MRILSQALLALTLLVAAGAQAGDDGRRFSSAELREDFAQMYRELQAAHFNINAFTSRRTLDRAYARSYASLDGPLTLQEAKTRFQLFAAQVHMGHTRVGSPMPEWHAFLDSGGKSFPLELRIIDGRSFVASNLSGSSEIAAGDEIIAMDGMSMRHWLQRTERHVSAETPYMAHSLMEYDFSIWLWVERGEVADFLLAVRTASGQRRSVRIAARSGADMATARSRQPATLDLERPLRDSRLLEGGIAYLKPGPFYNAEAKTGAEAWDVSGFQSFIDDAFHSFASAGATRLIVDLRGNPGGDSLFSDPLVAWIATRPFRFASRFQIKVSGESTEANAGRIAHDAEAAGPVSRRFAEIYAKAANGDVVDFDMSMTPPRASGGFRGEVYVLIDRRSYSNAVAVAALVQDYRFGTILGEETSDMATTYGAMEQFKLQHTGLMVGYPKARIVRPNGDARSRGVVPDAVIAVPVVQDPGDPVLRAAVAMVQRRAAGGPAVR